MMVSVRQKVTGVAAFLLVAAASPSALADQMVESFSGSWISQTQMPGMPGGDGSVVFNSQAQLSSIQFAPGPTIVNNQPFDLAGSEQAFLGTSMTSTSRVSGAGCSGSQAFAGPALNAMASASGSGIVVNPDFGPESLSINMNSMVSEVTNIAQWNSPMTATLNGQRVRVMTQNTLMSIDAATGLAEGHSNGQIFTVTAGGQGPMVPNKAGVPMLFGGLFGLLFVMARRRSQ